MNNKVFLLTSGDGSDGNEWSVISIHSIRALAEIAKLKYSEPQKRFDGSTYIRESEIEEWTIDVGDTAGENMPKRPEWLTDALLRFCIYV